MNRDYTLVMAWRKGDMKASEILFDENSAKLGRCLAGKYSHEETDDIVSETFCRAVEKLDKFRGESSFFTWLYSIALLVIKEMTRKEVRYEKSVDIESVLFSSISYYDNPEEVVLHFEKAACMRAAYAALKPEYQDIIYYRIISDLDYKTISARTGRSIDSLEKARRNAGHAFEKKFLEIYEKVLPKRTDFPEKLH